MALGLRRKSVGSNYAALSASLTRGLGRCRRVHATGANGGNRRHKDWETLLRLKVVDGCFDGRLPGDVFGDQGTYRACEERGEKEKVADEADGEQADHKGAEAKRRNERTESER